MALGVSDAKQSVYGIDQPGSGPGGRWLKSIRPAILHLLPFQKLSVFSCRHQSINPQHYA